MKAALIAVSALAAVLAVALVVVVLGGTSVTVGGLPGAANDRDAPPPREDGPTRRVTSEINDGSGWEDVDLEITLIEARTANPSREDTLGEDDRGKRWIAAEFEVRNRADDNASDSPQLVAVDADGQSHDGGLVPVVEPALDQLNVPAGGRRKGYLSVQVPDDAKIERLEVSLIGEALGWDLDRTL